MNAIALVIAVVALIIGLFAVFLAARGPQNIVRYTIKGSIALDNECDGQVASLPAQVKVKASLNDNRGQSSGGSATVAVVPDPNAPPGAPRKVGSYSITVAWGPGMGNPKDWDTPDATLANGNDICPSINCPVAGSRCVDLAQRTRTVAFVNPTTTYDISVSCGCVGP